MTTSEETVREAAMALASRDLVVIQREGGPDFPEWDRLTRQSQKEYLDQARALADAGLLRQEMTEEWVPTDIMGAPEEWRGTFGTREEAAEAGDVCCTTGPMRRYVTEWEEVPDGTGRVVTTPGGGELTEQSDGSWRITKPDERAWTPGGEVLNES